jgi:hypothetical protein
MSATAFSSRTVLVPQDSLRPTNPGQVRNGRFHTQGWYSQVGQDRCLASLIQRQRKGFYIDLAANHGVRLSNTYFLDRNLSWSGLCIEPNPTYIDSLLMDRTCSVLLAVVSGHAGTGRFRFAGESGGVMQTPGAEAELRKVLTAKWSTRAHTLANSLKAFADVQVVGIAEALAAARVPRHIDFFSLDVRRRPVSNPRSVDL